MPALQVPAWSVQLLAAVQPDGLVNHIDLALHSSHSMKLGAQHTGSKLQQQPAACRWLGQQPQRS